MIVGADFPERGQAGEALAHFGTNVPVWIRVTSQSSYNWGDNLMPKLIAFSALFVIVGIVIGACSKDTSVAAVSDTRSKGAFVSDVGTLEKFKVLAENTVRILKAKAEESTEFYGTGRNLYDTAQAGWNGWIEAFVAAVENDLPYKDWEDGDRLIQESADATQNFIEHVRGVSGSEFLETVATVRTITENVLKIAKGIYSEYLNLSEAQREKAIEKLRQRKWKNFDVIGNSE